MPFRPLADYTGYNHVLQAGATFVHPGNGNVYFCAVEQQAGIRQNLIVYRIVNGSDTPELVKRYLGTVDSAAQITMGSAVIGTGGALLVATSLVIPGVPKVTATGFQGSWIREPGVDAPWGVQQGVPGPAGPQGPQGIPGPQGPAGSGGGTTFLSARYTAALERLCAFFGL